MKITKQQSTVIIGFLMILSMFFLIGCAKNEFRESKTTLNNNHNAKSGVIEVINKCPKNKNKAKFLHKGECKQEKELDEQMTGLFWMSGLPGALKSNRNFEKYLETIENNLKKNQYIDGLHFAIDWKNFEPIDGQFDFQKLDQVVAIANKYNKKFKLILVPGVYSPEFIYKKGAKKFITKDSNKYHKDTYGDEVTLPLPWDKVYQKYFYRAIKKLAERYGNEKQFIAITVTGVNFMSPEMHLPNKMDDLKQWESFGDYEIKLEQSWKNFIDFFAQIFPKQLIGLELAMPMRGMGDEVERIVEYGINKHSDRFFIQSDQLNGKNDNSKIFSYKILLKYKNQAINGFQNLASFDKKYSQRQGSFEQTIQNFNFAEAEYYELWHGDGKNIELSKKIQNIIWYK